MRSEKRTTRSLSLSSCSVALEPGWAVNQLVPWDIGTSGIALNAERILIHDD
jgi:hypothetical protein